MNLLYHIGAFELVFPDEGLNDLLEAPLDSTKIYLKARKRSSSGCEYFFLVILLYFFNSFSLSLKLQMVDFAKMIF